MVGEIADPFLPLVSIVIPCHNMSTPLRDALDSVLAQTYVEWECIVVDDGSEDDIQAVVKGYRSRDCRFKYMAHSAPRGPSAARNTGIHTSIGKFVAFLDADDVWRELKLEKQVKSLEANPSAAMSCTFFDEVDENLELMLGWEDVKVRNQYPEEIRAELLIETFSDCRVPGSASAAFVRKECFEEVGLFDTELRLGEDLELWYRIALYADIIIEREVLVSIRKYPKKTNINRALKDVKYIANKLKLVAPDSHRALIDGAYFESVWGILVESLCRRRVVRASLIGISLFFNTPLRLIDKITGRITRVIGN
jgi:glycosyltransferase involved in cell wall biosynthesis